MREWKETRREGEELGPIDWAHPMIVKMEGERWYKDTLALLREAEKNPTAFQATDDGGCPKVGWYPVLRLTMWDGWPYWAPMPCVVTLGWNGARHLFFENVHLERKSAAP